MNTVSHCQYLAYDASAFENWMGDKALVQAVDERREVFLRDTVCM